MDRVFVVMAESGEYGQRQEWICGVYLDRDEAEKNKVAESEKSKAYEAAYDAWCRKRDPFYWSMPKSAVGVLTDEAEAEIVSRIGPRPKHDGWNGSRFCVIEVPVGTWGCHRAEFD